MPECPVFGFLSALPNQRPSRALCRVLACLTGSSQVDISGECDLREVFRSTAPARFVLILSCLGSDAPISLIPELRLAGFTGPVALLDGGDQQGVEDRHPAVATAPAGTLARLKPTEPLWLMTRKILELRILTDSEIEDVSAVLAAPANCVARAVSPLIEAIADGTSDSEIVRELQVAVLKIMDSSPIAGHDRSFLHGTRISDAICTATAELLVSTAPAARNEAASRLRTSLDAWYNAVLRSGEYLNIRS